MAICRHTADDPSSSFAHDPKAKRTVVAFAGIGGLEEIVVPLNKRRSGALDHVAITSRRLEIAQAPTQTTIPIHGVTGFGRCCMSLPTLGGYSIRAGFGTSCPNDSAIRRDMADERAMRDGGGRLALGGAPGDLAQRVAVHFTTLRMPNLVCLTGNEIEAFRMHDRFGDVPDTGRLLRSVGEFIRDIELEKTVHAAEGVNRIELVSDDANALREVHFLRVAEHVVALHLVAIDPIAMDAQITQVADPKAFAVETDRVDPRDILGDVPSLHHCEITGANLGDDRSISFGIVLSVLRTVQQPRPQEPS